MKFHIEAAKRLVASNLPLWSSTPDSKKYLEYVSQGRLPFGRTNIKIVNQINDSRYEDWSGSWEIDNSGQVTILIQKKFYQAVLKTGLNWAIAHLIQHEYIEAKTAIKYAKVKYPEKNPYVMAERDLSLGGEAHIFAIKELDGISESSYLANIKIENKLLGL